MGDPPRKHKTWNQCWSNVDPLSTTLDQHLTNIDSTACVCWVTIEDVTYKLFKLMYKIRIIYMILFHIIQNNQYDRF